MPGHFEKDLAIVLRAIPFQDRHKIITALTEQHGQISAVAKNSVQSRRFGGSLDLFTASEWIFELKPGADLYHLSEAQVREPFVQIRGDFEKLSLASTLNEIMLKLAPEREACPELFRLHSNALALLNEPTQLNKSLIIALLNAYLAKVLQWSGNQPQIQGCISCQASLQSQDPSLEVSGIIADAGWICSRCRSQATRHVQERTSAVLKTSLFRLNPRAIRDFQISLSQPIRKIPFQISGSEKDHVELFEFLEALFVFHVPGFDKSPIQSLRFLGLKSSVPYQKSKSQ